MIGAGSNYEFKADNPQGLGPLFTWIMWSWLVGQKYVGTNILWLLSWPWLWNAFTAEDTEIVEVGVEARVPEDIILDLGLVPAPAPEPVIVHARTPAHQGDPMCFPFLFLLLDTRHVACSYSRRLIQRADVTGYEAEQDIDGYWVDTRWSK